MDDIVGLSRPLTDLLAGAGCRSSLTLEATFDDAAEALELLEQLSPAELLAGIQARLLSGLMDGGVIEPLTATVRPPLVHTAMLLTPTQSCQVRGGSG